MFNGCALGGTSIAQPLNIGADVLGATGSLKLLKQEMGLTATQAGLLGAAIAVIGVAAVTAGSQIKDGADAVKQNVVGQIEAIKTFNKESFEASTEQAKERVRQLGDERTILARNRADFEALKAAVEQGLDVGDAGIVDQLSEGAIRGLDKLNLLGLGLDDSTRRSIRPIPT
jgi:parvulin-like peptidyl-prolyl isomerase